MCLGFFGHVACVSSGEAGMSTVTSEEADEDLESLKFNLNIESLGLVLYSSDPKLVSHMNK